MLLQEVLDEIGLKSVRPLRDLFLVKTHPVSLMTSSGLLWLPGKEQGLYAGHPHARIVVADILASGPECTVTEGVVHFQRLHFNWQWKLAAPDTYVGWVSESKIIGMEETNESSISTPSY